MEGIVPVEYEVIHLDLKKELREKMQFGPEDFGLLKHAADRIEELENALSGALEWNWLDADAPEVLREEYLALISKSWVMDED